MVSDAEIKVCFSSLDKVERIAGSGIDKVVVFDDRLDDRLWLNQLKVKVPEKVCFAPISTEECDIFDVQEGILDTYLSKKEWDLYTKTRKLNRNVLGPFRRADGFYNYIEKVAAIDTILKGRS